jgi:uncharacterized protein (TIGR02099 family)
MLRKLTLRSLVSGIKGSFVTPKWSRWFKRLIKVLLAVAVLAVSLHFGVRHLVWPQIEKSKPALEKLIGSRLGVTVTLDDVRVTWDGLRPEFEIDGLRFYSQPAGNVSGSNKDTPVLAIQSLSGELSLLSFYHLAPYFEKLTISNAELTAERNQGGIISIAGIAVDPNEGGHAGSDWLFSQNKIQLNNVVIHWRDREKKKLDTDIRIESLAISSGLRNHLIDLVAYLPSDPSPVRLSADFRHGLIGEPGNWRNWSGKFAWDLKGLNLNRLALDFKLPFPILEGILETRGSINLSNGTLSGGDAQLLADNLRIQFSRERDLLEFGRLEAEIEETSSGKTFSVTSKKLAWRDFSAPKDALLKQLSPMSFYWTPPKAGEEIRDFGFSSPSIRVEDATLFALNLPLPNKVHKIILGSKASGLLENVDIQWAENSSAMPLPKTWLPNANLTLSIKADLKSFSFLGPRNVLPSIVNLTGRLETTEKQGSLIFNSPNLALDISGFLADPKLKLASAKGRVEWLKNKNQWQINGKDVVFSNPDVSASLAASYSFGDPKQADQLSLDIQFDRATLTQVHRYLPIEMAADARTYLSKAFDGGEIQKGSLRIKGDPDQIPYSAKYPGEFTLNLPIKNAVFNPVPTLPKVQGLWPAFNNIDGVVRMNQSQLDVQIQKANYQKVVLSAIQARIVDVTANNSELTLQGAAKGELNELLDYIKPTPILIKRSNVAELFKVSGTSDLNVSMAIPLSGQKDPTIDIHLLLSDNQVQWADYPPLKNVNGSLRVTDDFLSAENLRAKLLGGEIKVSSQSIKSSDRLFAVSGSLNAEELKSHLLLTGPSDLTPLVKAMAGRINYDGQVRIEKSNIDSNFRFNLNAFGLNAPEPLKKSVNAPLVGRFNVKSNVDQKIGNTVVNWSGSVGERLFTQGNYSTGNQTRQSYSVGMPAKLPESGISFSITENELDLDAWQAFLKQPIDSIPKSKKEVQSTISSAKKDPAPVQVNAQIKNVILLNRNWPEIQLAASEKNTQLQLRITSPLIAGQLQWLPKKEGAIAGQLNGKLKTLRLPDAIKLASERPNVTKNDPSLITASDLPSLDISIDDFAFGAKQFGKVVLKASRSLDTLTINTLETSNPQDSATVTGTWKSGDQNQKDRTTLNFNMAISDLGVLAARWGNPKAIERGEGRVTGSMAWDGSPLQPQLESLSGNLKIGLEKGRLLKVDSTSAKIFSVLSLQSLFRFATLDLQGSLGNIVTQGTAFKTITGDFAVRNGVARTTAFSMELDQARVAMTGLINVPKETQDLRITIFPSIDATSGALAVFAINPIAGLGAFIGQYLVTNRINKAMQADYLVQGSWADPEIIPLNQQGQPLDPKVLESIRTKGLLKEQTKPSAPSPAAPARSGDQNTIQSLTGSGVIATPK